MGGDGVGGKDSRVEGGEMEDVEKGVEVVEVRRGWGGWVSSREVEGGAGRWGGG